jgi:hypothetical protein
MATLRRAGKSAFGLSPAQLITIGLDLFCISSASDLGHKNDLRPSSSRSTRRSGFFVR